MRGFCQAILPSLFLPLAAISLESAAKDDIRILPVPKTPESNTIILKVAVPKQGTVEKENPVWIQFRIDGYPLGTQSQFDRADEVVETDLGQTVHVVIDNEPYIAVKEEAINPFNEDGYYYDTSYKFKVPYRLEAGMHTIRAFPARSFGESLKGENTFFATYFYLGERKNNPAYDLKGPYLTYNEPSDQLPLTENLPILLDFYISNCELSSDGYKVKVEIDGIRQRTLTSWQPYYIYGLKRGRHTIRLQLLDPEGKGVAGAFNDVKRSFTVR